ncbi:hypothetical protein [Pseudoalteromonas sp. R3]|uniref:hypothetical protein n=1 Tax=Pseudoalteromonas sp. R3 TaxID=1709477 RepID=UPI000AD51C1F|nr:hypothetical protein [Pseudoalteromonas sp. R3]AZZ97614.1 hypothetical protein ELR70_11075 [Pseudoalteromonas sp. R3]
MKTKIALSLIVLAFVSGCNSTSSSNQVAKADTGHRCKQVTSLGSNIPNVYCSTRKEREEARKRGLEALKNSQATGRITGCGSASC